MHYARNRHTFHIKPQAQKIVAAFTTNINTSLLCSLSAVFLGIGNQLESLQEDGLKSTVPTTTSEENTKYHSINETSITTITTQATTQAT